MSITAFCASFAAGDEPPSKRGPFLLTPTPAVTIAAVPAPAAALASPNATVAADSATGSAAPASPIAAAPDAPATGSTAAAAAGSAAAAAAAAPPSLLPTTKAASAPPPPPPPPLPLPSFPLAWSCDAGFVYTLLSRALMSSRSLFIVFKVTEVFVLG